MGLSFERNPKAYLQGRKRSLKMEKVSHFGLFLLAKSVQKKLIISQSLVY